MGKKGKSNANPFPNVPEDVYVRVKKLVELKVAPKAPKGELTAEEWCIPPAIHGMPEFKAPISYWKQTAIVKFTEQKSLQVPSRFRNGAVDDGVVQKPYPRKEVQDLFKYCKGQVKQATKRTGQFLKQMEKKEAKELKRETLLKQIADVDNLMNEELRAARRHVEKQQLFEKQFMYGSKLGEEGKAPRKNALIVLELSDKQAQWIDEAKDEVTKLINTVIAEGECESLNIATFSGSNVTTWLPQYQPKTDPKKGIADSLKWINKNFSAKTCGPQSFPPDWAAMLNKFTAEGTQPPWRIFLCCSRSPEAANQSVLDLIQELRTNMAAPAKNEPILPINIVAFDPTIVGDEKEKTFFETTAGENGRFLIDTSAEDLVNLAGMLKNVQTKKKQLDKLNKKLDKMEDLSERVTSDRELLQLQIALQNMLTSDWEILDWALKNEAQPTGPEI